MRKWVFVSAVVVMALVAAVGAGVLLLRVSPASQNNQGEQAVDDTTVSPVACYENYTLKVGCTLGGSVTDPGVGTFVYKEGTEVHLLAVPDTCYRFDRWTGDTCKIADPSSADTTITMLGNYCIKANFVAIQTRTIKVTSNLTGASFSLSGPESFDGTAPWETNSAKAGTYTITWKAMAGYTAPPSQTKTLDCCGAITFHGIYTPIVVSNSKIRACPACFTFFAIQDLLYPTSQTLGVHNDGSGTMQWTVSSDASWLILSPQNGVTSEGGVSKVDVRVDISGMSPGTYYATITVKSLNASNSPQTATVRLILRSQNFSYAPPIGYYTG